MFYRRCYTINVNVTVYQGENFVLTNERILQKAASQPCLQNTLVLVPDRFTLQAERLLLKYQPHLLNTRVLTFSMLYRMVACELNRGEEPKVLDKTSAVLNLWTAIRQVQDQLVWFKTSAGHYDFAEKMFNTMNQMRSSCVDFTELENKAKTPVARKKYHDINLIYQAYQQIIQQQTDTSGMLEYLVTHLAECESMHNASIFVCGFTSLSPARLQVLQALCQCAQQVIIGASENELKAQLSQFPHYHLSDTKIYQPQIKTVRCETERGEANVVMAQIASLINQGVSPEDIVVLLTEFDTLAPVWQVIAAKYQVPVNLDVGTKLSTMADAKYLRDLLELLANDDAENTVAVLFNQCCEIAEEQIFNLENEIVKSNLRARSIPEIKKLTSSKHVTELCAQLKTLTEHEKLQNILEQISVGCGTQPVNLREFINLFWTLCSATKVSKIPQYLNRVLIAPVNDWVPSQVKHLFIANCTADNFPQGQSDDDILQEADLVGTQITPTPKLQRERNYRRAELLKIVAFDTVVLSGTCEDFVPVAYEPYSSFRWVDEQKPITVGQALFFPHQRVKPTMIESYYSCPRLNFIEKGLRLQPRPIYKLAANTVGTAIHCALQAYFTHHDLAKAVQAGLAELAFDYPPLTKNIAKEITFILKELDQLFATGKFKFATEVEKEVKRKLSNGMTLVGRVDRIDIAELDDKSKAFLVLDYKTGNVDGSIAKNIYLGNKLQLPIYASALSNIGRLAGAGYLPLSKGYTADKKNFMFKGFVDTELKDLFPEAMINPSAKYYVAADTISKICAYADQLVDAAVAKIIAGEVQAEPVNSGVCQFCSMRILCQHANGACRGDGVKVSYKTFEEEHHG